MKIKSLAVAAAVISVVSGASTVTGSPRQSVTYTVLHTFCSEANCADGSNPLAALVRDSSGNLFGTTRNGGAAQDGVIFELSPSGSAYTYQVLYNFCVDDTCTDGDIPTTRLVLDTMGNRIFLVQIAMSLKNMCIRIRCTTAIATPNRRREGLIS